jgi:nicotinamidase-related amidase
VGYDHGQPSRTLIRRREGETLITKRAPSAFRRTDIAQTLRGLEAKEVAVTSMCVDATTRAGADLGFKMTLVPGACAAPEIEFGGRKDARTCMHRSWPLSANSMPP